MSDCANKVSQSVRQTRLNCGWKYDMILDANLLLSSTVKIFF